MEIRSRCDLCGAGVFVQIHQQHLPTRNVKGKTIDVLLTDVMCKKCGLVFRNPRPTDEEFEQYYAQDDEKATPDLPQFLIASEHRDTADDSYRKIKKNQYEYFNRYLGTTRGRLLEVGCFEGLLLSLFKKDGWKVYGVEPSIKTSKIAREKYGIDVKTTFLKPDLWDTTFDAAVMVHVLEHVQSPVETLRVLRTMIRKGGRLCIEVPNILTFPENNLSPWFSYEHLYYFSPRTLTNVLSASGFDVLNVSGDFGGPIVRAIARSFSATTYRDTTVFRDEYPLIQAKIKHQEKHIQELRTRLENIVSQASQHEDRVVLYGAGVHTELLFQLADFTKMHIVGIVDQDITKVGHKLAGYQIYPVHSIQTLAPTRIIISSYAYQEEIYRNLQHFEPTITINKLYDYVFELANMKV